MTIRSPRAQIAESVKGDPVGSSSVGLKILFDTYHLTNNGEDLPASIRRFAGQIGHVQVADSPGRGEPGTGAINFPSVIKGLEQAGYSGVIAAEYRPVGATADGLGWIDELNKRI